jgi:hypothetical protein
MNEEEAIKFFEDYYSKLESKKWQWCKNRVRRTQFPTHPADKFLDQDDNVESVVEGEFILDEKNSRQFYKDLDQNIGRYP